MNRRQHPDETAMVAALLKVVTETRGIGFYDQAPYHPKVGCVCGSCLALRALARVEFPRGRCVLCACTDVAACAPGCSWVDRQHFLCNAHPEEVLEAALRFIEKWNKECTQTKEASHGKSEAAASNQGHRADGNSGSKRRR